MLSLFLAVASAAPTAIDVEAALELGMPRLHEPFVDCQCVGMTWDDEGAEPLVLEIPLDRVAHLERRVADGPQELALVLDGGERLVLEEAPCVFAESIGAKYTQVLGLEVRSVDGAGEPTDAGCGDVLGAMRAWSSERAAMEKASVRYMTTADLAVADLEVVSSKGEEGVVSSARRALAATRTSVARCLGQVDAPAEVRVTVKGARVKARPTGATAVDACMADLAASLALPEGKVKLKAVYSTPAS